MVPSESTCRLVNSDELFSHLGGVVNTCRWNVTTPSGIDLVTLQLVEKHSSTDNSIAVLQWEDTIRPTLTASVTGLIINFDEALGVNRASTCS